MTVKPAAAPAFAVGFIVTERNIDKFYVELLMINREKTIRNYIDGYNEFDLDNMVEDPDETIIFETFQWQNKYVVVRTESI
jgi:hypothetical protein